MEDQCALLCKHWKRVWSLIVYLSLVTAHWRRHWEGKRVPEESKQTCHFTAVKPYWPSLGDTQSVLGTLQRKEKTNEKRQLETTTVLLLTFAKDILPIFSMFISATNWMIVVKRVSAQNKWRLWCCDRYCPMTSAQNSHFCCGKWPSTTSEY